MAERQIDQDIMQNPYYGEVIDDSGKSSEKDVIEHSQNNFTAVTKIQNLYYDE